MILFNRIPKRTRDGRAFPFGRLKSLGFTFRRPPGHSVDEVAHWIVPPEGWSLRLTADRHVYAICDAYNRARGYISWHVRGPNNADLWTDFSTL